MDVRCITRPTSRLVYLIFTYLTFSFIYRIWFYTNTTKRSFDISLWPQPRHNVSNGVLPRLSSSGTTPSSVNTSSTISQVQNVYSNAYWNFCWRFHQVKCPTHNTWIRPSITTTGQRQGYILGLKQDPTKVWPLKQTRPIAENILEKKPPNFDESFKNPCWYKNSSTSAKKRLLCLPYIYILGFTKCGTSDLHWALTQHPSIVHGKTKESHWWEVCRPFLDEQDIDVFATDFFSHAAQIISHYSEEGFHPKVTLDASASAVWRQLLWKAMPENSESQLEPEVLNMHYIRHFTPSARLVVLVRDPTDRAFSSYRYYTDRKTMSVEDFHAGVVHSIQVWNSCLKYNSRRGCAYNSTVLMEQEGKGRLFIGMYDIFLQDWLSVFPPEQLFVIRTEDYAKNRTKEILGVQEFLGLGPFPARSLGMFRKQKAKHQSARLQDMLPQTRALLDEHYREAKQRLAALLNHNKYLWTEK